MHLNNDILNSGVGLPNNDERSELVLSKNELHRVVYSVMRIFITEQKWSIEQWIIQKCTHSLLHLNSLYSSEA